MINYSIYDNCKYDWFSVKYQFFPGTHPHTHIHMKIHTYVWCHSVNGEPSTHKHTDKCTHTRTHQYRETGVYTHTFLSLSIAFVCDTHLNIVTSLAVDLKRRLLRSRGKDPFPSVLSVLCCPTCSNVRVFMDR